MTLNIVRGPHSYLNWLQQHIRQPWPWPCIVLRGRLGLTTITTVQGSYTWPDHCKGAMAMHLRGGLHHTSVQACLQGCGGLVYYERLA